MRKAMCHYSFHRRWAEEKWDAVRLCEETKALGVDAVDFHAGLIGETAGAADRIRQAMARTGMVLSGLSLSTNFNLDDAAALQAMKDKAKAWMRVAAEVRAPVSRIFGGHVHDRKDLAARKAGLARILDSLGEMAREAERLGITLALENHGGLPCTGEEQVEVIRKVGSPNLRATIDVGNYMGGGQSGLDGTRAAAAYCAYVHLKDFRRVADASAPGGTKLQPCIVGRGEVDIAGCLRAVRDAGYDGFVALEYEGPEDEREGVPASVRFMNEVMTGL